MADAPAFWNRWFSCNWFPRISGPVRRATALVAIFASAVLLSARAVAQNASQDDIDRSTKPGEDFYRYANGRWLGTVAIPPLASSSS